MATKAKRDGRLLLLHDIRTSGSTMNIGKMADLCECSARTIYRDINRLELASAAILPAKQKLFAPTLFKQDE